MLFNSQYSTQFVCLKLFMDVFLSWLCLICCIVKYTLIFIADYTFRTASDTASLAFLNLKS